MLRRPPKSMRGISRSEPLLITGFCWTMHSLLMRTCPRASWAPESAAH